MTACARRIRRGRDATAPSSRPPTDVVILKPHPAGTLEQGLGGRRVSGALLFTCNGRGSRLFAQADHDAGLLAKVSGDVPVGGFFCGGELGPVGGKNFLHGFTASIAAFLE